MISNEVVTQTWQCMSAMPESQTFSTVTQMRKEQPFAMTYLLAMSQQEPFDEHEGELLFYIGMVIWQIMKQSQKRLRKVTEAKLDEAEQANEQFLDLLASDTEGDFLSATKSMLEDYSEPNVLRYITEALMEDEDYDEDDLPMREESIGYAFYYLKVVLDAFISSVDR